LVACGGIPRLEMVRLESTLFIEPFLNDALIVDMRLDIVVILLNTSLPA
jgi:hypothetical protein